jgi:beta-galactosidase
MQAALTRDYFKNGWAASWESTGGPQQFSGGKGGNVFTVDEGTMTQLMLNYIAAGYRGFGFWSWSVRTAGWEAGEFSLLDRHNQVTPRAVQVGRIGQACRRHRDELWAARKEPLVGIYCDWDNEAIWAAMSVKGREHLRQDPIDARVGVSRALINANVPFEYVTATDLRNGLGPRYRILYCPAVIALPRDILRILGDYAQAGGRLVMDMPSAYYDENGTLLPTDAGTDFEKTFGVVVEEYQGAGVNRRYRLQQLDLRGFVLRMRPTGAEVLATYDDGHPAVSQHRLGRGTAVLLGYEASKHCVQPGDARAEAMLLEYALGPYESPYRCEEAVVYRLAAPAADHYFLINDDERKTVALDTGKQVYRNVYDAVSGARVELGRIELARYSGRWLRCEHRGAPLRSDSIELECR